MELNTCIIMYLPYVVLAVYSMLCDPSSKPSSAVASYWRFHLHWQPLCEVWTHDTQAITSHVSIVYVLIQPVFGAWFRFVVWGGL